MATPDIPSSDTPRTMPPLVVATQRFLRRCWLGMLPVVCLCIWLTLRMIGVGNYTVGPDALARTQEFAQKVMDTSVSPPGESTIRETIYSLYDGASSRQRPMQKRDFLFSLAPSYDYSVDTPTPAMKVRPEESKDAIIVKAIMYSETDPEAIIGKQFVKRGDRVKGWTVKNILADRVVLRKGQKQMTLKANFGSGATP